MAKMHPDSKFVNTKFSKLKLTPVYLTKYFKMSSLKNISINLDERFFDIKIGNHFDNFVKITLPYFNKKGTRAINIKLPLKQHKHSNSLLDSGYTLKSNIQLKQIGKDYYINLVWFKEAPELKTTGKSIGIDLGYKKLITTSNKEFIGKELLKVYTKLSNKEQGSKKFKKLLKHRDNLINYYSKQLKLDNISTLVIENLLDVKKNTKGKIYHKVMNKLQRLSYTKTIEKLTDICLVNGIKMVKVSPAYTSQTCSNCGNINKHSRNGEKYKCISCGNELDADYNAAINIRSRGVYSLSS